MKKIIMIAVTGILFFAVFAAGSAVHAGAPGFVADGKAAVFDEVTGFPYITDQGLTMMPVRVCLDMTGCEVSWDSQSKTVMTRKGDTEVDIPVGKKEIFVNKKAVPVDAGAVLIGGRTYLPLRAVLEAYGYLVQWDGKTGIVSASSPGNLEYSPFNINGGTTGIFSRKQLRFEGFRAVRADVTLPVVTITEKGDCPYVYFGFDWRDDNGNVEGGFQFIEDPNHPSYNKWTVFMRQGNVWRWGDNISLEQGSVHNLEFHIIEISDQRTDLVIELDGREIIRKASSVTDFSNASVKAVNSMAMSKPFDGDNCLSRSEGAKITNLEVMKFDSNRFQEFETQQIYREWKPASGKYGMWFGTADCIPSYLHFGPDGSVSIYKEE